MKKIILIVVVLLLPFKVSAYSSNATSTILMDTDNNRIIYASNSHKVRSIASITKIMTAIISIESNKLYDEIEIGDEINKAYGSGIYITKGEKITVENLLYGLMLRSGNDAALALANYIGGNVDNFVRMMNEKAKELGMNDTTFNNPSGLDDPKGNYSTAYDMALLSSYAIKNDIYRKIVSTKKYTLKTNKNYYIWYNKNKLLNSYKYTVGGKTGYTEIAKRTLVTNASKDGVNLTVVTLNDGDDFVDHKNLYEEAFNEYKNYEILKKGYIDIIDEDYYSNRKFFIKDNFNYILKESEKNDVLLHFKLIKKITYNTGDKVGTLIVYLKDKELFKTDVYIELKKKKVNVIEEILGWFK